MNIIDPLHCIAAAEDSLLAEGLLTPPEAGALAREIHDLKRELRSRQEINFTT